MKTKLIGIKDFRQNIARYYAQAKKYGWRYIILSRNKPIWEVKPLSDKEAVLEKLAADIEEARQDVKAGRVYPLEDALQSLGL